MYVPKAEGSAKRKAVLRMRINYNVTGEERKSLVGAISHELNIPVRYLGAPTFAYEIGGYRIDKNGILTGEDNPDLVAHLQGLYDFKAVSEEYDTPCPQPEPAEETVSNSLSIEMPRLAFTDAALENLKRLVESKGSLIQSALGVSELPLEVTEETVRFPWFTDGIDAETVKAYTHFITALCEMARTQQRINATEKPVDNEKYAFRCFLLRLGFIGLEYKSERKILLSKLAGNSAFKNSTVEGTDDE